MPVLQSSEKQISCLGKLKALNICARFIFPYNSVCGRKARPSASGNKIPQCLS